MLQSATSFCSSLNRSLRIAHDAPGRIFIVAGVGRSRSSRRSTGPAARGPSGRPFAALVRAHVLRRKELHAQPAHPSTWITHGGGCTLFAVMLVPPCVKLVVAQTLLRGLREVRQHRYCVERVRLGTAFFMSTPPISPNSANRSATLTMCVTSRSGSLHERSGDDQRHPHARLIRRALRVQRIERRLDRRRVRAVVAEDHDHGVGRRRVVDEIAVRHAVGDAELDEQAAELRGPSLRSSGC